MDRFPFQACRIVTGRAYSINLARSRRSRGRSERDKDRAMSACVSRQMGTALASRERPAGVKASRRLRLSSGSGQEEISPGVREA
jgi:hypothetical protein